MCVRPHMVFIRRELRLLLSDSLPFPVYRFAGYYGLPTRQQAIIWRYSCWVVISSCSYPSRLSTHCFPASLRSRYHMDIHRIRNHHAHRSRSGNGDKRFRYQTRILLGQHWHCDAGPARVTFVYCRQQYEYVCSQICG